MTEATCPRCENKSEFDPASLTRSMIRMLLCPHCQSLFRPSTPKKKRGRSDSQRRSQAQEKRAAARYGGRVQPASGSKKGAKGDFVNKGVVRGECKTTTRKSFSLKLEELLKIEGEAHGVEVPLLEVEFSSCTPPKTYAVIPSEELAQILHDLDQLRRGNR